MVLTAASLFAGFPLQAIAEPNSNVPISDVLSGIVVNEPVENAQSEPSAPKQSTMLQGNVSATKTQVVISEDPPANMTGILIGEVVTGRNPHSRPLQGIHFAYGTVYEPAPQFNAGNAAGFLGGVLNTINTINSFGGYGGGFGGGGGSSYAPPRHTGCR